MSLEPSSTIRRIAFLFFVLLPVACCAQQKKQSACDNRMSFCWYDDEVEAWGQKWVSGDPKETIEGGMAFRCMKNLHVCIRARAVRFPATSDYLVNTIEVMKITNWDDQQVSAQSENYQWEPCDRDTYILNRVDKSVTMISSPGAKADTSACTNILGKPRTITYKLAQ